MKFDNKFESPLKMSNLKITNSEFNCISNNFNTKLSIQIIKEITQDLHPKDEILNDKDELSHNVKLITTISSENKEIYVSVTCSAIFSIPNKLDLSKNTITQLIEKNSIAIMFPYVRSYITLITSVPNMNPIIIPPININKVLDEQADSENNK